MKPRLRPSLLLLCAISVAPFASACSRHEPAPAAAAPQSAHCLPGDGGYLRAQLRGAISADLDWHDADIRCEGGPRPDGHGLRVSIAGPLPASAGEHAGRTLRFVFGIETAASVSEGRALATNLTAIIEGSTGSAQPALFATRGADKCTLDHMERRPIGADAHDFRVDARGFCLGPASSLDGTARLHVTTFDFAGRVTLDPP